MKFETPDMMPDELGSFLKWFEEAIGTDYDSCETRAILYNLDPVNFCLVEDKLRELINYY